VLIGFTVGIFYKQKEYEVISTILLLVMFVLETAYHLIEKQSKVVIIPTRDARNFRNSSLVLLLFAILSIFIHFYNNELTLRLLAPAILFGYLGLRGFIFTEQTL